MVLQTGLCTMVLALVWVMLFFAGKGAVRRSSAREIIYTFIIDSNSKANLLAWGFFSSLRVMHRQKLAFVGMLFFAQMFDFRRMVAIRVCGWLSPHHHHPLYHSPVGRSLCPKRCAEKMAFCASERFRKIAAHGVAIEHHRFCFWFWIFVIMFSFLLV